MPSVQVHRRLLGHAIWSTRKKAGLTSGNHLLCGMTTIGAIGEDLGEVWAKKMTGSFLSSPESVKDAWFDAGQAQYQYATNLTGPITFRVAGWDNCLDDTLKSFPDTTSDTIDYRDRQVYP